MEAYFDNLDARQIVTERRNNKQTAALADVLGLLVHFGFYGSVCEIKHVADNILQVYFVVCRVRG